MKAPVVDLAQWKKSHPPVIVCLNAALAMVYYNPSSSTIAGMLDR